VAIEKGELLLAVRGVVGRVQIDGDAAGAAMQPFAMARDDAVRQRLAQCATSSCYRSISKPRQRAARPDPHRQWIAGHHNLCTGIACQTCGVVGVFISPRPCPSPLRQQLFHFVQDLARLPLLAQTGSQRGSQTQPPVGRLEQDRAAIGTALALIKLRNHRPLKNIWESKHSVWYVRSSEGSLLVSNPHRQRFCTMASLSCL